MQIDLYSGILLIGAVQGYILAVFLFIINKGNTRANKIYGLLIILESFRLTSILFVNFKFYIYLPSAVIFFGLCALLSGPTIFLYTKTVINKDYILKPLNLLHLIPFFAYVIYTIPFFIRSYQGKLECLTDILQGKYMLRDQITAFIICIQVICYIIFSLLAIKSYHEQLKKDYSSITKISLSWLKAFIFIAMAFTTIDLIPVLFLIAGNPAASGQVYGITILFHAVFQIIVPYYIIHKSIFSLQLAPDSVRTEKYSTSSLSDSRIKKYWQTLTGLLEKKRLYLEPELKLDDLADLMGVSRHHLSQVINSCSGKNFYDLINEYRIKEVKKMLFEHAEQTMSILSIAFESGFNSKSSFNQVFKKHTGTTPPAADVFIRILILK
jgi:AraC-like DNA-binding protein